LLALVAVQTFGPAAPEAQVGRGGLLMRLSETALARWINESGSLFGYPGFLFLHSLGLAFVVGVSAAVDLRVIGVAPGVPLVSLRALFPVIWLGFSVSALSGAILFIADASGKSQNPVFEIKLVLVALGVMLAALTQRRLHRLEADASDRRARVLAVASLLVWLAAIVAGRLVAYTI
jgi:hypothetical protein